MFVGVDVGAGAVLTRGPDGETADRVGADGIAGFLRTARRAGPVGRVVAAVPDAWFRAEGRDAGLGGAASREAALAAIAGELGWDAVQLVPYSVAVPASHAPVSDGSHLVCGLGRDRLDVGWAEVAEGVVGLRDTRSMRTPGEPAVLAGVAGEHRACAADRARRADLLYARARAVPRYRAAPAYPQAADAALRAVTAGAVVDGFARVADALRGAVEVLGVARLFVHGELVGHPLAAAALRGLSDSGDDELPSVTTVSVDDAARGAMLLAQGVIRGGVTAAHTIGIAAHRLRRGRLETLTLPVARAGEPVPNTVVVDGIPVRVRVPSDAGSGLGVEVRERGSGPVRRHDVPYPRGAEPGEYVLGAHAVWPGDVVAVLRPVAGGDPLLMPLGVAEAAERKGGR